ncbi:uncharacterized protein L201_004690 [Kwoniella dendrophila CBS 6074]|uniref:Bifunctional lycopene cyclase/phytoene synthase n=1 Tax=Kwoniella dendrophila CBS 6074 TaxID=1295534 RepID=A0AAX4JXY9_9TREE
MFTYIQIHLYFIIPPILLLTLLYFPVLGRREMLKFLWLGFMATIWTTPWDNFILSQEGWSYPPNSILGKIGYVPIEEHMFFILQPILLILLHSIFTHGRLLPFDIDRFINIDNFLNQTSNQDLSQGKPVSDLDLGDLRIDKHQKADNKVNNKVDTGRQTLPRRPISALGWITLSLIGLRLILKTHQYQAIDYGLKHHMFYLSWILFWICPVIGFLTFLGAKCTWSDWKTLLIGTGYFWIVDTIALKSGSWSISKTSTLNIEFPWSGLPIEEAIFFFLTSYLIILSSSLISHLHTILILSPDLPPCPPKNPISHIMLLAKVAFNPPKIDQRILIGLKVAERILKKGSSSFEVAKLAFSREMRLGLVVVYAWCRVTDNLIDEPFTASELESVSTKSLEEARQRILKSIRRHLIVTYENFEKYPADIYPKTLNELDKILDDIPNLTLSDRTAFQLFSLIIPRLVPKYPFLELCDGYSTDLKFPSKPIRSITQANDNDITSHLPIQTQNDLLKYADDVAGSIASAICYLSWSILEGTPLNINPSNPINQYTFAEKLHSEGNSSRTNAYQLISETNDEELIKRLNTINSARIMGCALQLVNISRDIAKDALISRLYVPLSYFNKQPSQFISILFPKSNSRIQPRYELYTIPLLNLAEEMRNESEIAIEDLPRISRGGTRAMVSSYFEISNAIIENQGKVYDKGIKVNKWKRIKKAAKSFWIGN